MKEVSTNKKWLLPALHKKKQVDKKKENTDESNMLKENIIKEMF